MKYTIEDFKIGQKVTLNPKCIYYQSQGFDENGKLSIHTIVNINSGSLPIRTNINSYEPHHLIPYIEEEKEKIFDFQPGDEVIGNILAECYSETGKGKICLVTRDYDEENFYVRCLDQEVDYRVEKHRFDLHKKKEKILIKEGFNRGDIVRCIVDHPRNVADMCKKGDLIKVNEGHDNYYFSSLECNGKENYWTGLQKNEFEMTGLTFTTAKLPSNFEIGDTVIGNSGAKSYGHTKEGWKGTIESFKSGGTHFIVKGIDKTGSFTVQMNKFDLYEKRSKKYKFNIGETVKVIYAGAGIGNSDLGKFVTITKLGTYAAWNGYLCEPAIGNCSHGGFVGEQSFEKVDAESIVEKLDPHTAHLRVKNPFDWSIPVSSKGGKPIYFGGSDSFDELMDKGSHIWGLAKPILKDSKTTEPPFFKVERI